MKRTNRILLIFTMLILLVSCVKQIELTEEDKAYIFMPGDVQGFEVSDYVVIPMKNGEDYFFTRSQSKQNGVNMLYGINYFDVNKGKIGFKTIVNLQSSEERAIELFNSVIKTQNAAVSASDLEIIQEKLDVDDMYLIATENSFDIVLRKDNLFYQVQVDGVQINLEQVQEKLMEKFNLILKTSL